MAQTISLPARGSTKRIGLETWMNRVLELADAVQEGWKAKDVHDLRVALRRCRTMADTLSEVNPDRGWRKLKKDSRELFRALGELRDTHVEQEWLKKLSGAEDPVRKQLLKTLAQAGSKQQKEAEKALEEFDRKNWKKWSQKLGDKAQFFPLESVVFQRLALTRLNEAAELYQRARKGRSRIAWHRLRIGLKGFRYTLENFMPQRYEPWSKNLKRIQDLLGAVHDMDVLRSEIRRQRAKLPEAIVLQWYKKIEEARKTRLDEFRSVIGGNGNGAASATGGNSGSAGGRAANHGKESLWQVWRAGFQAIHVVQTSAIPEAQRLQSAS
jgi:CHAD domain-containing protein